MDATTVNQSRLAGFQDTVQTENVAAERVAQNSLLSELPGATCESVPRPAFKTE